MPGTAPLSVTTIVLHWATAASIAGMIGLGLYMSDMPRGPAKVSLIQLHKSLGVMVLALVLVRIGWRIREGWPEPAAHLSAWEARLARATHWFLLIIPIGIVASGIVRSLAYARPVEVFGLPFIPKVLDERNVPLNDIAGAVHDTLAWALVAVITVHVAAALRHHVLRRDATLRRMLGLRQASGRSA